MNAKQTHYDEVRVCCIWTWIHNFWMNSKTYIPTQTWANIWTPSYQFTTDSSNVVEITDTSLYDGMSKLYIEVKHLRGKLELLFVGLCVVWNRLMVCLCVCVLVPFNLHNYHYLCFMVSRRQLVCNMMYDTRLSQSKTRWFFLTSYFNILRLESKF